MTPRAHQPQRSTHSTRVTIFCKRIGAVGQDLQSKAADAAGNVADAVKKAADIDIADVKHTFKTTKEAAAGPVLSARKKAASAAHGISEQADSSVS